MEIVVVVVVIDAKVADEVDTREMVVGELKVGRNWSDFAGVCTLPRGESKWTLRSLKIVETFHFEDGQNFAKRARRCVPHPTSSLTVLQTDLSFSPNPRTNCSTRTRPLSPFPQPAPRVLDFLCYPSATSHDPASFCFLPSVRECRSTLRMEESVPPPSPPPHLISPTVPRIIPDSRPPRTPNSTPRPRINPSAQK